MSTPQSPPARPYRDFLTPFLHRRFTSAALLTLGVCYVEAVLMGQWDLFWSWFPFGKAGLRTLMLFISILAVYILRVAQLHIGARTTVSPLQTFRQQVFSFNTAQTLAWYSFSAWFFCEVYIWSAGVDAKLAMVDPGKAYERARLNERPIYLRTMFMCLAVAQAVVHLYNDYDRVRFPAEQIKDVAATQSHQEITTTLAKLRKTLYPMAQSSVFRIAFVSVLGPIVYAAFLRRPTWHWAYFVARQLFSLPKNAKPTTFPPHIADLIGRFLFQGFLLVFLWEFANTAFGIFVAQEPLKKGHPLTNDSADPNGSLLAGLKAKKEVPRNAAFWELALIAHQFPERRATIYKELDRAGGSTWKQILIVCLGEFHGLFKRIGDFQNPPSTSAPGEQPQPQLQSLPKITNPIHQDNIFQSTNQPPTLKSGVGSFAKSIGQAPGADPISPHAKKLLTYGADKILSKDQQQELSPTGLSSKFQSYMIQFLQTPLGAPFRHTFKRHASAVVLGTPYGGFGPIIDAINALTKLAVCSLKEDSYGQVHQDVANIMRTFTSTAEVLDNFIQTMPFHWTDVEAKREEVPEVAMILAALREGLRDLVNEFGEFKELLGLSVAEMRKAKETVAAGADRS